MAASDNPQQIWDILSEGLHSRDREYFNVDILHGVLTELNKVTADRILDDCLKDSLLSKALVRLHPTKNFTVADFKRCLAALKQGTLFHWQAAELLWRNEYAHLPEQEILRLITMLLKKEAAVVVIEALFLRIHPPKTPVFGSPLIKVALEVAQQAFRNMSREHVFDTALNEVLQTCFASERFQNEKYSLVKTIAQSLEKESHLNIHSFESYRTVAAQMPKQFIDEILMNPAIPKYNTSQMFSSSSTSALSKITPEYLTDYCCDCDNPDCWRIIAQTINVFRSDGDKNYALTPQALAILEAAPEPKLILRIYHKKFYNTFWTGSLAQHLKQKLQAFTALLDHDNPAIREAIRPIHVSLSEDTEAECVREQKEDAAREQRFE